MKLFIVNDADKPCERLIAEEREGALYYIHPDMQKEWSNRAMSIHEAAPLEHFGIKTSLVDGWIVGILFPKRASAHYPDGKPRNWQGNRVFRFLYPEVFLEAPPAQ